MASSAEAQGGLLRAAGVEDEVESTAPSSAVRVSLPSREGGSPAVGSAPRTPPGDPMSSPWRSSLFSPRDGSLSAVRRVVDGSSQTQDSFYDTPDSGSVSDESLRACNTANCACSQRSVIFFVAAQIFLGMS